MGKDTAKPNQVSSSTPSTAWTPMRQQQLEDLRDLLYEVSALNNGTSFLNRATKCIETAERLKQTDWDNNVSSFIVFLYGLEAKGKRGSAESARKTE